MGLKFMMIGGGWLDQVGIRLTQLSTWLKVEAELGNNSFNSKNPKSKKSNVTFDFCTTCVEYFHSLEEFGKNPKITYLLWISLKSFG